MIRTANSTLLFAWQNGRTTQNIIDIMKMACSLELSQSVYWGREWNPVQSSTMHLPLILALITPTSVLTANSNDTTSTTNSTTTKNTLSTTTTAIPTHYSKTTTKLTMKTSTSASQSVTTKTQADTNNAVAGGASNQTNPIGEYIINRVKKWPNVYFKNTTCTWKSNSKYTKASGKSAPNISKCTNSLFHQEK